VTPRANFFTSTASAPTRLCYTISSTGKRHDSRCRYGSGRPYGPTEGVQCKILRRLTIAILCALLASLQHASGEVVRIVTWNLEWFPGRKPNSSQVERLVHMSAAKDALIDIRPDVLCLQEVRGWDSVAELVSVLPNFQTLVVSRFREMGSSGPLSIEQLAIASNRPAEAAWSEPFKPSPATPPRGFSFSAIRRGKTVLLVYCVHFKSNIGDDAANIAKREEAARQLLEHAAEMESAYSVGAKVVTIIAGDFNTDPTDARFASEKTFALLKKKFVWAWEKIPLSNRVTNPARRHYPVASFDGFLVRGDRIVVTCNPITIPGIGDHFPVVLTLAFD
jgi:endonuclease/exonuclease/phosphatase family metal-dependent hydrolase